MLCVIGISLVLWVWWCSIGKSGRQIDSQVKVGGNLGSDHLFSVNTNRSKPHSMVDSNGFPLNQSPFVPQKLYDMPSDEFQKVVLAAERSNDVSAAVDLAEYYGYAVYDVDKEIKYLEIAASHGHTVSQYNLGFIYYSNPRVKNYTKAEYWLHLAAKAGDKDAERLLSKLDQWGGY